MQSVQGVGRPAEASEAWLRTTAVYFDTPSWGNEQPRVSLARAQAHSWQQHTKSMKIAQAFWRAPSLLPIIYYLLCQQRLWPEPTLAWVGLQARCEQMLTWLAFTLSLLGRFWAAPGSLNPAMHFFQRKTTQCLWLRSRWNQKSREAADGKRASILAKGFAMRPEDHRGTVKDFN